MARIGLESFQMARNSVGGFQKMGFPKIPQNKHIDF